MKSSNQNFTLKKTIHNIPMLTFSLTNKQDLRDIITNYILHHLQQYPKTIPSHRFKSKYIQYPSITLKLNINNQLKQVKFKLVTILTKYIEYEKKNIYRSSYIEPLIVDILNFIDEIEDRAKQLSFIISNTHKIQQQALNLIIEKYHKDKQKKNQIFQLNEYHQKTTVKHTSISYLEIGNQFKRKQKQFLIQISSIDSNTIQDNCRDQQQDKPNEENNSKQDKMKELIQSGELFQNPAKIQQLKKEKLIEFYHLTENQYKNNRTDLTNKQQELDINNFTPEFSKIIKDWIIDINLSSKYYEQKFNKPINKIIYSTSEENLQSTICLPTL